jgi:hypothetical protein
LDRNPLFKHIGSKHRGSLEQGRLSAERNHEKVKCHTQITGSQYSIAGTRYVQINIRFTESHLIEKDIDLVSMPLTAFQQGRQVLAR